MPYIIIHPSLSQRVTADSLGGDGAVSSRGEFINEMATESEVSSKTLPVLRDWGNGMIITTYYGSL
jgi:hypothetical protein